MTDVKLLLFHWNQEKKRAHAYLKFYQQNVFTNHIYIWYIFVNMDLALNEQEWLICDKKVTKPYVTANRLKSQNGTLFSHVWRRGRLALDPLQNKSCSEFFSQAHKNWHITWGNNLGPDWPPLAKGFQISHYHTPTRPPKLLSLR